MNTKKRLLAVILTLMMLLQVYLPVHAAISVVDLEAEEYQLGKITIESNYDSGDYDALLYKETPEEYLIMLDYREIAALGGLTCYEDNGMISINRHSYTVEINTDTAKANIYIENDSGKYPLYGEFTLDHIAEYENKGIKEIYLPMEQLFYLLNYTWFINDYTVYVMAPADTLLSFAGEFDKICQGMPDITSVLANNVWEQYGNAFKYTLLSVADELDYRVIFYPLYTKNKMESALLEMAAPVSTRFDDEQVKTFANELSEYQQKEDEFVNAFIQGLDVADNLYKAIWELNGGTIAEWNSTFGDFENALTGLKTVYSAHNILKASKTALELPENYLKQIEYMTTIHSSNVSDRINKDLNNAAKAVIRKYSSEFMAGANQFSYEVLSNFLDWGVGKLIGTAATGITGLKFAVSAFKFLSSDFAATLETGDSMFLAKDEHNISHILLRDYLSALDSILRYGVTPERLENFRLRAYQTLNAAGHCYYNIYKTKETEEDISADEYEDAAIEFAVYLQRLTDSLKYDESLILDTSFSNLNYEKDITSTEGEHYGRPKVPEEYVCMPWKKAYAEYLRDNQDTMAYMQYYQTGEGRFSLVNIDGNNIPELIIIDKYGLARCLTYDEKKDSVEWCPYNEVTSTIPLHDYKDLFFTNDGQIFLIRRSDDSEWCTLFQVSDMDNTNYMSQIDLSKNNGVYSYREYDITEAATNPNYYSDIFFNEPRDGIRTEITKKEYDKYFTEYGFDKAYGYDRIESDEIYPINLEGIKEALGIEFDD